MRTVAQRGPMRQIRGVPRSVRDSVVVSSPPVGCPGAASRRDCRANGLRGVRDRRAMSQLTVYLKLEPSDKSKKSSNWESQPPLVGFPTSVAWPHFPLNLPQLAPLPRLFPANKPCRKKKKSNSWVRFSPTPAFYVETLIICRKVKGRGLLRTCPICFVSRFTATRSAGLLTLERDRSRGSPPLGARLASPKPELPQCDHNISIAPDLTTLAPSKCL